MRWPGSEFEYRFAFRQTFLSEEFHHRVTERPEQLIGHLDHGSPGAVDITVRRQTSRKAAAAMPNLHTYDHERQPRDLHFNIDEGIQALAVDDARICKS